MSRRPKNGIKGNITIEGGANVWPHELHTATALANAGYNVRFIPANASLASADAYIDNTLFEFKSPEGSSIKSIDNNLQKALRRQSRNIVIDSFRVKNVQDRSILHFLEERLRRKQGIKRLLFVTRDGKVIDINALVR
ncbi:hypothetical protein IKG73_03505 [Candidatus Saccharibacteria bacterium]|nr:hypothetical protein [Candidatus Saccharibacteria bacterium]